MSYLWDQKDVPSGYQRWVRAVNNYNKNSKNSAAQLLAARIRAAYYAVDELGGLDGPFIFWKNESAYRSDATTPDWKRKDYACSVFCAALKVTLDCTPAGPASRHL